MAAAHLPGTTDHPADATAELFLDSEPEVCPATTKWHALDNTQKNCYTADSDKEDSTVPVIFAVGKTTTAVLLCAVKGGVRHQKTIKSAIFKVLMSLFLLARFFHRSLDTIYFSVNSILQKHIPLAY